MRYHPVFVENKKRRVRAPFSMPAGASPVDVSLRLREHGWAPYRIYFELLSQAWIAIVIDWKRAA
jgi:hypothetical protein